MGQFNTQNRNKLSLLAYAASKVIDTAADKETGLADGIYFHKIMSLLQNDLAHTEADLNLPHCWYFYGDEVVRSAMPYQLQWNHDDASLTRVGWRGRQDFSGVDPRQRMMVDSALEPYVEEFPPGAEHINKLIDRVYSYAPFDFQRRYRSVKGEVYDISGSTIVFEEYAPRLLRPTVRDTLSSFPSSETLFAPVAGFLPVLRDSTDTLLESPRGVKPAYRLLVNFWEFFCYHLRTHPRANDSVPRETLEFWNGQLETRRLDFQGLLGKCLARWVTSYPSLESSDAIVSLLAEWEKSQREFEDLISDPGISG